MSNKNQRLTHQFDELLNNIPQNSDVAYQLICRLKKKIYSQVIKTEDKSNVVYFNGQAIRLKKRKKIYRLFKVLKESPDHKSDKVSLIKTIYNTPDFQHMSYRQQSCYEHNIVKLISRARKIANQALRNPDHQNLYWFPYDSSTKTWTLYRRKEEY